MELRSRDDVMTALTRVGELLAAEGNRYAVVIVGGAALNLLRIVERTTTDVDILAFADAALGAGPPGPALHEPPDPLPAPLLRAARTVARDMELDPEWLNAGPALQWKTGLPPGLEQRVGWHRFASLWVGVVSRADLISLKLYAAADSSGTRSVHYQDLVALQPTATELDASVGWVATQDATEAFARQLGQVVTLVRSDVGHR
jgi:hypothetical protein